MTSTLYTYQREVLLPKEYRSEAAAGTNIYQSNLTVRINDETFSFLQADLLSGLNRHSGKRWHRWQETSATVLSLKKKDSQGLPSLRVYDIGTYPQKYIYDNTMGPHLFSTRLESAPFEVQQMFCDFIESRFGKIVPSPDPMYPRKWALETVYSHLINLAYPGIELFNHQSNFRHLSLGILAPGLRERSAMNYTRKLFAKKHYRKDLVKALAEAPLELHSRAVSAAGLVPTDWIIDSLRTAITPGQLPESYFYDAGARKRYREFLRAVPPTQRRRYLLGAPDRGASLVDVPRMLHDPLFTIDFRRYHSIEEIHAAWVDNQCRNRNASAHSDIIPMNKQTEKIVSVPIPEFEVVPAKTRADLVAWSSEMGNCIQGYYYDACQPTRTYLGVYQNGKLLANVEIDSGKIKQFLGKYNDGFASRMDTVRPILDAWTAAQAINPNYSGAWGLK